MIWLAWFLVSIVVSILIGNLLYVGSGKSREKQ